MVIEETSAHIQYMGRVGKSFWCILTMLEKSLYLALIFDTVALLTGTALNTVHHSSLMHFLGMKILFIFFIRRPVFVHFLEQVGLVRRGGTERRNNVQGVGGQMGAFSVYQRILNCSYGACKLCTSMRLRTDFGWSIEALYCTCNTVATPAMQYANPTLHSQKDLITFMC